MIYLFCQDITWECIETSKKKLLWIILLTISVAVLTACLVYFIIGFVQNKPSEIVIDTNSQSSQTVSSEKEPIVVETPVNFNELKSVNDEIYAWINIPNANVNYPILQSKTERSYYLSHNVNKQKSSYGAIYTQNYNKTDFSDYNTIIYGHNMKNGTMFGSLKRYRDKAFFDANQYIEIYMPGRILKYRVFAAYTFDDRHILMSFNFSDVADRQLYLETIYGYKNVRNHFRDDVTVTTDDKIITLSTCTSNDEQRFLVQGVLVYDSQNP